MGIPIEELLGKEIKAVILETFQDFLISKNDQSSEDKPKDNSKMKKSKKDTKNTENEKTIDESVEKASSNSETRKTAKKRSKDEAGSTIKLECASKPSASSSSKSSSSAKSLQLEKLKSYVFKCGVRKNW